MQTRTLAAIAALVSLALMSQADARPKHRHSHGIGACDGYHRCRCGVTAANFNGLPLTYNGHNLKQAREFVRAFAQAGVANGMIGYVRHGGPTGHVFTVVNYAGGEQALVHDDAGTYQRSIRGAIFLDPNRPRG